jgi:cytochrome c-type biogenesis protein CcmH/NrfG
LADQLGIPVGFIAGLLTGAVAVALAVVLWRQLRPAMARLRYLLAAGLVAGLAIAAVMVYLAASEGEPGAGSADSAPVGAPPQVAAASATPVSATSPAVGAASALPASPTAVPAPSATPPTAPSAGELERRVTSHPEDANAWLALAEERRAQHDLAGARDAYARVVGLQRMSAQSWADYADVLSALAGGSLSGEAGAAIDSALSLDAWNPRAMWLKASQKHQQHNDAEALVWWRRLRTVLPPESGDAPVINAKIAEAEALTNVTPPPAPMQMGR